MHIRSDVARRKQMIVFMETGGGNTEDEDDLQHLHARASLSLRFTCDAVFVEGPSRFHFAGFCNFEAALKKLTQLEPRRPIFIEYDN